MRSRAQRPDGARAWRPHTLAEPRPGPGAGRTSRQGRDGAPGRRGDGAGRTRLRTRRAHAPETVLWATVGASSGRGGAGRGRDEGGQGAGPRWSSQPPASVRANPAPLIRRGRSTNCIAGTAHASAPGLCAEPQGRENQSHFQQSDVAGSPERDGTVPDSAVTPLTCFGACAPTPLRRPAHGQAAQSWGAGGQVSRRRRELRPGQLPPHREGGRLRHRTPGLTSQPRRPPTWSTGRCPCGLPPPPPWALPPMVPCHLEPADLPPGCPPTECGLVETFKIIELLPS